MTKLWKRSGALPNAKILAAGSLRKAAASSSTSGECGRRRVGRGLALGLLMVALMVAPFRALAAEKATEVAKESGLGAAAAVSSLFYAPVKLVYATGGLMVGAVSWLFTAGDGDVAEQILTRSLRGTYVITPEILQGEEPLEFVGRDGDGEASETESVSEGDDESEYLDLDW